MKGSKPRNDATASTRGSIYQLAVAVKKCYELQPDEQLLIEELGDVTILSREQVEVKQYADNLTDNHPNFWNTLKNWLDANFDHTPFKSLILHTTQELGSTAHLATWNSLQNNDRIALLQKIHSIAEERFLEAKKKDAEKQASSVLKLQREILSAPLFLKLQSITPKIWIDSKSSNLPELYNFLLHDRIKGVLPSKKEEYLDSLIGYTCRANMRRGEQWSISYDDFEAKIAELNATYNHDTREFPQKGYLDTKNNSTGLSDELFISKIKDIQYEEVLPKAIHHYQAALVTLEEEFRSYRIDSSKLEIFIDVIEDRFEAKYRQASRKCADSIPGSQDFYDEFISEAPPEFSGFTGPIDWFKNGLIHLSMNEQKKGYVWKLK